MRMSNFRVGQKVVCVVDAMSSGVLQVGRVYTVERIVPPTLTLSFDGVGVRPGLVLCEVENPFPEGIGFNAHRFRPAVDRGTQKGMSILRELLNKQPQTVREEA
jgi:hypothetical protein